MRIVTDHLKARITTAIAAVDAHVLGLKLSGIIYCLNIICAMGVHVEIH